MINSGLNTARSWDDEPYGTTTKDEGVQVGELRRMPPPMNIIQKNCINIYTHNEPSQTTNYMPH